MIVRKIAPRLTAARIENAWMNGEVPECQPIRDCMVDPVIRSLITPDGLHRGEVGDYVIIQGSRIIAIVNPIVFKTEYETID